MCNEPAPRASPAPLAVSVALTWRERSGCSIMDIPEAPWPCCRIPQTGCWSSLPVSHVSTGRFQLYLELRNRFHFFFIEEWPNLLPLKISVSAVSWKSKAGDFCPLCILHSPSPQSWPAFPVCCWQHYSYVNSGLYTREGVEISLSSSADVILVLFHCIVFTIDVLDLKSWSVVVFIVGIIFVNPYYLREPQGSWMACSDLHRIFWMSDPDLSS